MYVVFRVHREWDQTYAMEVDVCTTQVLSHQGDFLEFAKSLLDGAPVDVIGLDAGLDLWIADDGKYAASPPLYNISATQFAYSHGWVPLMGDFVAGTAILANHDDEGETTQLDPVAAPVIAKRYPDISTFVL